MSLRQNLFKKQIIRKRGISGVTEPPEAPRQNSRHSSEAHLEIGAKSWWGGGGGFFFNYDM
jgi:hypothetical protein